MHLLHAFKLGAIATLASTVVRWGLTPIVQGSYIKPDVSALPTDGVELTNVPQTAPLFFTTTGVTANGDGTFQFVSSTKYGTASVGLDTRYIMGANVVQGDSYRLTLEIDFVSGVLQLEQLTQGYFKEPRRYTEAGIYTYSEIIEVAGVNPIFQFTNVAISGFTTEVRLKSVSVQRLEPQEVAYANTAWIPSASTDWSISAVLGLNEIQSSFNNHSGLKDETSAKYIAIGQASSDEDFKMQLSICGDQAYQYIDSPKLGVGRHHCVGTYNATTKDVSFYIGGKLIGTQASSYTVESAREFWLGHLNTGSKGDGGYASTDVELFNVYESEFSIADANEALAALPFVRLSMAGDSTFTGALGWYPKLFPHMPNNSNLIIQDTAKGGATAKTFYDDGSWEAVKVTKPKYIFLGFGQNDWTGGIGIDSEFKPTINLMLDEALANGITPYLFTPCLSTISGSDGTIRITNNDAYGQAIEDIGTTRSIPVVNLTEKTRTLYTALGPVDTAALHLDSVHFNNDGAEEISKLIREELDRLGIMLTGV